MALIKLKFFSESLRMQSEMYVIMPQKSSVGEIGINKKTEEGKYKCLYLLHGLSDDHSIWMRRTSIERYAADFGICVVMPEAHRSFYTDMKYGGKYYTYIAKEVPRIVQEFFRVSDKTEDNYIAGLSMGGYGALKIALREHGKFCAAAGLSTVADIRRTDFAKVRIPIWGEDQNIPVEDDLFELVEQCEAYIDKPRLYMVVGTEDYMYEDNVRLRQKIESLDYDYTYSEAPGTHCWKFWDGQIQNVLKWMFKKE